MGNESNANVAEYWGRDLVRHRLLADGVGQRLWKCKPTRGWASIVTGAMILLGVEISVALLSVPMDWMGVPNSMWAVFIWIPWFAMMLGVLHIARSVAIRRAPQEQDEVFVAVCVAAGASARVGRAVRRALARAYGVPTAVVSSIDTGWSLSRFMEAPAAAEIAEVVADELGAVDGAARFYEKLKLMRPRVTVAELARVVMDAERGR